MMMGHTVVNILLSGHRGLLFVCKDIILLLFNNVNTLLEILGTVSTCGKKPVLTLSSLKAPGRCQVPAGKECDFLELLLVKVGCG